MSRRTAPAALASGLSVMLVAVAVAAAPGDASVPPCAPVAAQVSAAEAESLRAAAVQAASAACPPGTRLRRSRQGSHRVRQCLRRRDRVPHGPMERRDRHGHLVEAGVLREGLREGPWLHRFSFSADLGSYRGGQKHGRWLTRLDDGVWQSVEHHDGALHGELRKYTAAGACTELQRHKSGRPHGVWAGTWPGGGPRLHGGHDDSGHRHGLWRTWHEDGSLAEERHYRYGRAHGPFRSAWPGGGVAEEGRFDDGERSDEWRVYDLEGAVIWRARYAAGQPPETEDLGAAAGP